MTVKKKPSAKTRAAKPKSAPTIQECPAYRVCQEKKVDCEICMGLSVEAWREHVGNVLAHGSTVTR